MIEVILLQYDIYKNGLGLHRIEKCKDYNNWVQETGMVVGISYTHFQFWTVFETNIVMGKYIY